MIGHTESARVAGLHGAVLAALFLLQFILPAYHHGILTRIMVLAAYAVGYNILFGYTGLLSLGHAMFFCRWFIWRRIDCLPLAMAGLAGLCQWCALRFRTRCHRWVFSA